MNPRALIRTFTALAAISLLALPVAAGEGALSLVPANATTVGMVKLADMRSSPLSSLLFQHTDQMSSDGEAAKFLAEAGLSPARDVDVLVVATSPRSTLGSETDVLVIAEGRFEVQRLTAALISRGAIQQGSYIIFPDANERGEKGAVAFPTSSLALAGNERAVAAALAARAAGGTGFTTRGSLAMDLGRIDPAATAWALIDVPRSARLTNAGNVSTGSGQPGEAIQAALRTLSTIGVWATDTGESLRIGAVGLSKDAETLELLEDTIRGALSAMRLAARDKAPEMVTVLRRFDVKRRNSSVTVEGSIPASTLRDLTVKHRAAATAR